MNEKVDEKKTKELFINTMKFMGGALSSLKLYPETHPSVTKTIEELYVALQKLIGDKNRIVIAVTRNIPVLDGVPVYESNVHLQSFAKLIQDKGIELIIIKSSLKKKELVPFIELINKKPEDVETEDLNFLLEKKEVKSILIKDINFTESAKDTYFSAIDTIEKTLDDVRMGNKVNVYENKRAVKSIVNSILIDKSVLLSLSMIKNFNDYLFSHSVNVCILASSLAEEIGFNDEEINEIGLGGLLHDIGKLKTPKNVLLKPGKLNDKEWQVMRQHPSFGFELIYGLKGIDKKIARMVYEHHMRPNVKGYPKPKENSQPIAESQVIAIADTYDACTTLRPYQDPLSPAEAMAKMKKMTKETGDFNTDYLEVFFNMMGLYPIGTAVRLDTNELALVSRYTQKRKIPIVKIFMSREGKVIDDPKEVDLNDKNIDTGKPLRSIIAEVDILARNIDPNVVLSK
jgi:putative nucleotidyltransferase with HDIG domain